MTNYEKGRRKEWKIMKELESKGWICLRTAHSQGFADIIAISRKLKRVIFIQSKPKTLSQAIRTRLNALYRWINGYFGVEFIIK